MIMKQRVVTTGHCPHPLQERVPWAPPPPPPAIPAGRFALRGYNEARAEEANSALH